MVSGVWRGIVSSDAPKKNPFIAHSLGMEVYRAMEGAKLNTVAVGVREPDTLIILLNHAL